MLEKYAVYSLIAGLVIGGLGFLWLTIRAFRYNVILGVLSLLGIPALFVLCVHLLPVQYVWIFFLGLPVLLMLLPFIRRYAFAPTLIFLIGCAAIGVPYFLNFYFNHFVSLGPREEVVNGEKHLTLTGWDEKDYSIIKYRDQTAVLQMANQDVTDEVVDLISGHGELKELDLSNTSI